MVDLRYLKLVRGWPTPLKNMKVSWDDEIPIIWKNKHMFQTTNQKVNWSYKATNNWWSITKCRRRQNHQRSPGIFRLEINTSQQSPKKHVIFLNGYLFCLEISWSSYVLSSTVKSMSKIATNWIVLIFFEGYYYYTKFAFVWICPNEHGVPPIKMVTFPMEIAKRSNSQWPWRGPFEHQSGVSSVGPCSAT